MKWFIASDLHGSVVYCEKMIAAYEHEKADRLLLLGDILSSDPEASQKVAEMLNALGDNFVSVLGNCDPHTNLALLQRPPEDIFRIFPAGKGHMMFATHGHMYNSAHLPPQMQKGDILLHGHAHTPMTERHSDFLCFNPGSIAQPRSVDIHGYMTLQDGVFLWKTLDGEKYREYPLE